MNISRTATKKKSVNANRYCELILAYHNECIDQNKTNVTFVVALDSGFEYTVNHCDHRYYVSNDIINCY